MSYMFYDFILSANANIILCCFVCLHNMFFSSPITSCGHYSVPALMQRKLNLLSTLFIYITYIEADRYLLKQRTQEQKIQIKQNFVENIK